MLEGDIIYAKGDSNCCFAVTTEQKVVTINKPLIDFLNQFNNEGLVQVNLDTLINTRHFVKKLNKREIQLNNGSIHKVSRKVWKEF